VVTVDAQTGSTRRVGVLDMGLLKVAAQASCVAATKQSVSVRVGASASTTNYGCGRL